MGIGIGMRGKDLQKFLMVAREFQVILLVRHTNAASLHYVGQPGYYPKPALIKAKTADLDPPPAQRTQSAPYRLAGLVVHPGMQPLAYAPGKLEKAKAFWDKGMALLAPAKPPPPGSPQRPDSWTAWGVSRTVGCAPEWRWRVDVDPRSRHYGCLQLSNQHIDWSYIHGDYDLKDVIVPGREGDNRRHEGELHGVANFTPLLSTTEFERVRTAINRLIGAEMVQHGAEAQFAWHGDEPITVAFPNWTHLLLADAVTVQRWYEERNRQVLAAQGTDYVRDRSRMFHFGPQGLFAPGAMPGASWG